MKLQDLASKPQLVKLTLDDDAIIARYGEALEFYVLDKLPIDTYTKLASMNTNDAGSMYLMVKDLILDDTGKPVIHGEYTLPMDIMNAAIIKVTDNLGKSLT